MSQQDRLTERYGAPSPVARRALVTVVVVWATAALVLLALLIFDSGNSSVRSGLVAWDVLDEHTVTTRVDVRLEGENAVATCLLRATAEDHTVVGELRFDVRASDLEDGTILEREIRTERRATSVEAVGCTTADQQRPR